MVPPAFEPRSGLKAVERLDLARLTDSTSVWLS
jgi:hypothetical protein